MKIGRRSAEEAYAAVRPLVSVDADNEGRRRLLAVNLMVMPEVLHAVGVTNDANLVELTLEKDGREITTSLSGESIAPWNDGSWVMEPANWVSARAHTGSLPPLWLRHPDRHYWHAFLDDGKTLYVQYNQVQDEPGIEPISTYFPRLSRKPTDGKSGASSSMSA